MQKPASAPPPQRISSHTSCCGIVQARSFSLWGRQVRNKLLEAQVMSQAESLSLNLTLLPGFLVREISELPLVWHHRIMVVGTDSANVTDTIVVKGPISMVLVKQTKAEVTTLDKASVSSSRVHILQAVNEKKFTVQQQIWAFQQEQVMFWLVISTLGSPWAILIFQWIMCIDSFLLNCLASRIGSIPLKSLKDKVVTWLSGRWGAHYIC
ncbi:hypothetical protein VNO77_14621 [Canavalia gladiata]|uniref:Uncharacterized protein n=1 Tax=Canavalia gladiata TaxID=3824 RepID=A0AAN9M206_CANGL